MELVGTGLGDKRDLTTRRAALVGAEAGDGGTEFLHGIKRHRQHGVEAGGGAGGSTLGIVDVDAIERDIVLVALGAGHFTGGRHAGLQAEQVNDVARDERELADLKLSEGVTDRSIRGVDGGRLGHNVDRI